MNLDFKIAFSHPNPEYALEITIFIGADMPHWVKKFRNATAKTHSRDLCFRGCGLMLDRLHDVHKQLNDSEVVSRTDLRVLIQVWGRTFQPEFFQ